MLQHIFDKIALADNVQYLVRASYLEIYNEEIRDLLSKVKYVLLPPHMATCGSRLFDFAVVVCGQNSREASY